MSDTHAQVQRGRQWESSDENDPVLLSPEELSTLIELFELLDTWEEDRG